MSKLYIVIFVMGLLTAIINAANGSLAGHIGLLESTLWVHAIGLVTSFIYLLLMNRNKQSVIKTAKAKPYLIFGGFIGSIAVVSISFALQTLGIFLVSTALIAGQFLFSFIVDTYGWFGFKKIPLTKKKALSLSLMIVGLVLISL